jgi:AmiR/NasT family two-component response regulator
MTIALHTIAIADDDSGVRRLLANILMDLGYESAGEAGNGSEALALVRAKKPDLILLDFHMPLVDGLAAIREIAACKTTAVVMITADTDPAIAREALDLGASGYMLKPFDPSQIAAVMESAWHRFRTVSSLELKTQELQESLEVRKLLEKAKGILMEQQQFSEDAAHKVLLKMSQDQGISLKEVCRSIIQVKMVLGKFSRKTA